MMHPDAELRFISFEVGYGLFARKFIPKGTITYIGDPLEIRYRPDDPALDRPKFRAIVEKYATLEPEGYYEMSWDLAKYINHCCNYNSLGTGWGFEVVVRDIPADEEITDDYGLFNVDYPMTLICRFENCRGRVGRGDYNNMQDQWNRDIREALTATLGVAQPLMTDMDDQTRDALMRYLKTGQGYIPISNRQHVAY